jgi:hypothetical protein
MLPSKELEAELNSMFASAGSNKRQRMNDKASVEVHNPKTKHLGFIDKKLT